MAFSSAAFWLSPFYDESLIWDKTWNIGYINFHAIDFHMLVFEPLGWRFLVTIWRLTTSKNVFVTCHFNPCFIRWSSDSKLEGLRFKS